MESILSGNVLWSYDYEVLERTLLDEIKAQFSGVSPFHCHSLEITLIGRKIIIVGDLDLEISLGDLTQIYLGFDEVFPRALVKNFGLFWQPLRLSLANGIKLYLINDYNMLGAKNQFWFNSLTQMLKD